MMEVPWKGRRGSRSGGGWLISETTCRRENCQGRKRKTELKVSHKKHRPHIKVGRMRKKNIYLYSVDFLGLSLVLYPAVQIYHCMLQRNRYIIVCYNETDISLYATTKQIYHCMLQRNRYIIVCYNETDISLYATTKQIYISLLICAQNLTTTSHSMYMVSSFRPEKTQFHVSKHIFTKALRRDQ